MWKQLLLTNHLSWLFHGSNNAQQSEMDEFNSSLCSLKVPADDIFKFPLFFIENWTWHFMQIVSWGDNLHEVSDPIF